MVPDVSGARVAFAGSLLALLLTAPPTLGASGESVVPGAAAPTPAIPFSVDRLIVEWKDGADRVSRVSAREEAEVSAMRTLGDPSFQLVRLDPGQDADEALASLRQDPNVRAATRDTYSAPNSIPSDPLFGELWGLQNLGTGIDDFSGAVFGADVNAPLAWDRTVGSPSTVIADLDSGYRFDSPDLGPVAWENTADPPGGGDDDGNGIVDDSNGADFVGPSVNSPTTDGNPTDDNLIDGGHGVHTAGTMGAAGDDGVGITGVAQDVRIMPLRVCSHYTDPTPSPVDESGVLCPTSSQIAAINYAGSHGARVANMSLGGTTSSQTLVNAIAANLQTLFVISAGNDGVDNESEHHYPCDYRPTVDAVPPGAVDNIVCVAATNQADVLAGFSDWGATSVDLGAPGTETLSTYPAMIVPIDDDFETNDFSSQWETTGGTGFGRAAPGDGPLTSFGMNDSPGGAPVPSSTHVTTLKTGAPVPAGSGSCTLSALRFRRADAGSSFFYQVLSDDSPVFTNTGSASTVGSNMVRFNTVPISGLGGHSVKVRFGYTAGSSPNAESGVWLDDIKLTCYAPLSTPPGYEFLQGTSMAAPHVTGAAGLLFSLKPSATVTEVREALLAGADPNPSLAGKTVSGGRLDVAQAMDALEGLAVDKTPPAAPSLTATNPASPAPNAAPKIIGSAEAGSMVQIYLGGACKGAPTAEGTASALASPGIAVNVPDSTTSQFSATATDKANNRSGCSVPISYTNNTHFETVIVQMPPPEPLPITRLPQSSCKVPRLAGKTLGQAKAALSAAGCSLGKVNRPRARKGHKAPALVVKSSSPAAGATATGGVVGLTLGPKPKKPHR